MKSLKCFLSLPGPLVVDDSGLDPGLELGPRLGNEAGLAPLELVTPGLEIPVEGLKPSGDKDPGLELSVGVGEKKGVNGGDGKGDHGSSGGIGVIGNLLGSINSLQSLICSCIFCTFTTKSSILFSFFIGNQLVREGETKI